VSAPSYSLNRTGPSIGGAIDRVAEARPIPGNRVEVLQDGPQVYRAMLDLIDAAERRIHFENYIIRSDGTGRRFAEALIARAKAGVEVRLLFDWMGSMGTARRYWRALRAAGVEVLAFNRPSLVRLFGNLSRDHRKLVVVDDEHAVIGGLCIGDEWVGDAARDVLPWRDTAVAIDGPAAVRLGQAFGHTWWHAGGSMLDPAPDQVPERGNAEVRVLQGEPGRERTYRVLEILATVCVERLWITDAYLVPPPRLFQALLDAAREGVDIRLLVPGSSDVPWIRNLTRIGYRDMLRGGIRIWEWEGPMLHAKTLVADGQWTRIGSSNLNASSLLGNYELDVLIQDPELGARMEAQFRRDVARSREVLRRPPRVPAPLQRVMPSSLMREAPATHPEHHHKSARELRRRAVVLMWTLLSGARRSIYGPISLLLAVLAVLFVILPRTMATVFGGLCIWLGVAAAIEAFRRRRELPIQ
jgi:cardiolipin synthase